MSCDIVSWVEVYDPETNKWNAVRNAFPSDDWERSHYGRAFVSAPFRNRNYGLFGFLAGVRNYSCCEPLDKPRGLPVDFDSKGGEAIVNEDEGSDPSEFAWDNFHSHSWFVLSELLNFDYDKVFWNRRIRRDGDGAALAQDGEGVHLTYREFLGLDYFDTLKIMQGLGTPDHVRVVFCFGD